MNPGRPAFDPPFLLAAPEVLRLPLVFNSPHSGSVYPPAFLVASRLDPFTLRRSEDCYIDELFTGVVGRGAPLLAAAFPRAYLDVNREPYELDPKMFDGRLPAFANTRSMRVAGGLGTIPRIVGDSQEIYARRLPAAEATARIETLYKPYHRALRQLIGASVGRFGSVMLVDCHSMPSAASGRDGEARADIVLGDRYGTSCAGFITDVVEEVLAAHGLKVVRNRPYAGGFITEHYGLPSLDRHALQIEINRALYMDEQVLARGPGFAALQGVLMAMVDALAGLDLKGLRGSRLAAE